MFKARKCILLFSLIFIFQSVFMNLLAQKKSGFSPSFALADNLLGETIWSNFNSRFDEKDGIDTAKEIPLTTVVQTHKKPSLDFDPILQLFQIEQESAGRLESSFLVCSLEEPASFQRFSENKSPFSNIKIQTAITREHFPQADSFLIDCTENVTLMLGGIYTEDQVPDWLAVWNKLVFNFQQPKRGECQFYFQHFKDGIIILGNNSVQAKQKIYLILIEKSAAPPNAKQPEVATNLLKPLRSRIGVKFKKSTPGPCSILVTDFHQNTVRMLEHRKNSKAGIQIANFWDGCNDDGMTVANGIYYYRILDHKNQPNENNKLKMIVLR